MGSPEIVVVEESGQALRSVSRGWVGSFVGPASEQGLDEAFGLAVGSGVVGLGA